MYPQVLTVRRMVPTKLCLMGDSSSVHLRRWALHFSKTAQVMIISDSPEELPGVKVVQVFRRGAGIRNLIRVPRMRREVRLFKPDIVHGHYLTVGGLYAVLSKGKRIVGSAWGSDIYLGPRRSGLERAILRFVLRRCDLVFAGTKDMADQVRNFGYDGKIEIFRWGVDPDTFKKMPGHGSPEFRILSIRPCDAIYNPVAILDAFKIALPDLGNAYLYMFDFGDMIDVVHELVEEDKELTRRVRFVRKRPYAEMPAVYNMADLAVSIPNSDSAAASVLEAMSCELAVIASDIPNMREWIEDGVNGFLTEINSVKLAENMIRAREDRPRLAEMGAKARAKVLDEKSQGTFESSMKVAEKAYEALLKERS